MGIQERKQREREQRMELILDAAEKVFLRYGIEKATMDQVATACELSKATLYLYYKSKEELFAALAYRGMTTLTARFQHAVTTQQLVSDKTRALGRAYLEFFLERPENLFMLNHSHGSTEHDVDSHKVLLDSDWFPKLLEAERELWDTCFSVIESGVLNGEFRPEVNHREITAILWASSNGLFQLMDLIRTHETFLKDIPESLPFQGVVPVELYIKTWEYTIDSIVTKPETEEAKRRVWQLPAELFRAGQGDLTHESD